MVDMIKPGIGREYEEEEIMKKCLTVMIALAVLAAGGAAWAADTNTFCLRGLDRTDSPTR
jgi:hypothetical protein